MDIQTYIATNEARFFDELFSLIRIPSISAKPEHKADMMRCAERWQQLLLEAGADHVNIMPSKGNPIVYGEKRVSPDAKTVLVYAHYDVMPAEPLELWKSDPPSLEAFCEAHKELLKADIILVSDTSMLGAETPSLTTGLRGLAYWQIEVTGPYRDLHSGHFGGAVANPINTLCELLAKVIDHDGRITIPHFYDDVLPVPPAERDMIAKIPFNLDKYKQNIDINEVQGEIGYSTLERNSCRPSFDVCGIWGGYTGEGSKTVLPSKAYAKVSCRLVANQNHETISQLFIDYMHQLAPKSVRLKVTPMHGGQGYVCPINLPAYEAAEKGFEKAFGQKPLAVRRGGSIPIISTFEQVLGVKTILMGFGLESNAIHSPNENFDLTIFRQGIEAVVEFYREYGKQID